MASSSIQKSFKYDVFLSFCGDQDMNFVDNLYDALKKTGIYTFKGYDMIEKGKRISDQLIRSIEDSRFHIIAFSNKYASSSWCLDELVKIMECHKTIEQSVYPVFYDVEPTDVSNQSGEFGEAFAVHEKEEAAGRWRHALKKAADLVGWVWKTSVDGHEEAKFIHKIVEEVYLKPHFINRSFADEKLVGMETRVKNLVSSLEAGSDDVRMLGIKGIGGSGKTVLAETVFNHISIWFEAKSFIGNVSEASKHYSFGLSKLQTQVLKDLSNEKSIHETSVSDGKILLKKMMRSRKILLVLDDVDDIDQLEVLAGEPTWFKPGSRIIITTRDEQVLVAHGVKCIYDVNLLKAEEAICLLSRQAFARETPDQGYEQLSREIVHYAAGLPLTLKVLGSFLDGRSKLEWLDVLERLKAIPLLKIVSVLERSYNGLEDDHKEIFLDVACMLRGEKKDVAIRILESCGLNAQIGLRVLEQKSLITISDTDRLLLHDRTEEMGKDIVRRMHPYEPHKHSRLWITEEIEDILVNELGTEATRSIKLHNTDLHADIIMNGLRKMKNLKYLCVEGYSSSWKAFIVSPYLPDTLRCLHWHKYPFRCLPETLADNLVKIEMVESNISQLWEGGEKKVKYF